MIIGQQKSIHEIENRYGKPSKSWPIGKQEVCGASNERGPALSTGPLCLASLTN